MLALVMRLVWTVPSLHTAVGVCAVLYTDVRVDATLFTAVRVDAAFDTCLLYTSPSPRDKRQSRMPSSA